MASFHLAPSLQALGNEVSAAWTPAWPTLAIGDGWVGDTSHAARKSDHNPDWDAGGVVRAVDIGIEGRDAARILNAAIGDPRVWYVIHKARIYSRTYNWESRAYTGSNRHNHHIHISIQHTRAAETDTSPWLDAPATEEFDMDENKLRQIIREELDAIRLEDRDQPKIRRSVTGLLLEIDKRLGNIERAQSADTKE